MEKYVRKNGYVEVWIDGEFVGNYDTIEEYHKEQEEEGEQPFLFYFFIIGNAYSTLHYNYNISQQIYNRQNV